MTSTETPTPDLRATRALLDRHQDLSFRKAKLEAELAIVQADLDRLEQEHLPFAVRAATSDAGGQPVVTMPDGTVLRVKRKFHVSVADKDMPEFVEWLRDNFHTEDVRTYLEVDCEKPGQFQAGHIMRLLKDAGYEFTFKLRDYVHPTRLRNLVIDEYESGGAERLPSVVKVFAPDVIDIVPPPEDVKYRPEVAFPPDWDPHRFHPGDDSVYQ